MQTPKRKILSNKKNKKPRKVLQKQKIPYLNISIIILLLCLVIFLSKIFLFDSINNTNGQSTNIEQNSNPFSPQIKKINKQEPKEEPIFKIKNDKNISAEATQKSLITKVSQGERYQKEKISKENKDLVQNKAYDKTIKLPIKQIDSKLQEQSHSKETRLIAIIIDDVTTKAHVQDIINVGFPITMAFMPPTSKHKDSANIASRFPIHMVHLPLEASSRGSEETDTLHVGDSLETIDARIKKIRQWYPDAKYINNHTGSKFTEDEISMDRLIRTIKKYNFIFVDSRTTPKTLAEKYTTKYGFRYIHRNVFLDHIQTKQNITNELKRAIMIAKKSGSVVVIGHPHDITLKTLKESKALLDGLDVVLIDKI